MLPSCEAMAKNVRAHCENMAKEISRRVVEHTPQYAHGRDLRQLIENQATLVLLDWFLGDWTGDPGKLPGEGDSNSPAQGS
jgi:hypothetical protein